MLGALAAHVDGDVVRAAEQRGEAEGVVGVADSSVATRVAAATRSMGAPAMARPAAMREKRSTASYSPVASIVCALHASARAGAGYRERSKRHQGIVEALPRRAPR